MCSENSKNDFDVEVVLPDFAATSSLYKVDFQDSLKCGGWMAGLSLSISIEHCLYSTDRGVVLVHIRLF